MISQWHILGAGAIGRLLACKLKRAGLQPVLVVRHGQPGEIRQRLRRNGEEAEFPLSVTGPGALSRGDIQGLFVTTKANDAVAAVTGISGKLAPAAPVILLHNGMGVLEQLAASEPALNLLAGTTTEGAYLEGEVLVHAGIGDTVIGREGQDEPGWFSPFADSDEGFCWMAGIDAALWKKLLINCAINPLTAVHRCHNGQLLADPSLRENVEALCAELAAISAARGNHDAAREVLNWTWEVVRKTASNQSSMLQDVLHRRPTEIDFITGYLVREAKRLGVPCPRNEALLHQLDSDVLSN